MLDGQLILFLIVFWRFIRAENWRLTCRDPTPLEQVIFYLIESFNIYFAIASKLLNLKLHTDNSLSSALFKHKP